MFYEAELNMFLLINELHFNNKLLKSKLKTSLQASRANPHLNCGLDKLPFLCCPQVGSFFQQIITKGIASTTLIDYNKDGKLCSFQIKISLTPSCQRLRLRIDLLLVKLVHKPQPSGSTSALEK